MARLNATITNKQLAGWTDQLNKYNAKMTAEYAARNPPEVFTPLDIDGFASLRCAEIGNSYVSQAEAEEIEAIRDAYRSANQAKRDAIKAAAQ